ncbi:sensor histidine kinase [Paenibacillus sacheonensis]|uniref:histidine kinase n=1 Tax=Paenibacillus sacheonensis TaxID=742054 RepID=A0A7X4YJY7_9BACL|nr:ATP-binding protein [Paenibacillus sacheonensis]NBC67678.1 HAMP domain-containing protein [Paenibacillus sacheonensis]
MAFRNSIAFRLFAVTFIVIMLFAGLLLALLAGGFPSFYEQRQKSDVAAEFKQLGKRYAAQESSGGKPGMPAYVTQFDSDYYAKTAVLTVRDGVVTTVLMSGSSPKQSVFFQGGIHGLDGPDGSEMILVPNPPLPSELAGISAAVQEWTKNEDESGKVLRGGHTVVYRSGAGGGTTTPKQLIAVTPVSSDGARSGTVLLSVSSLQPITHAAAVFKGLSLYVFGAAFIFVLLLAFGYATIITKPLIRLNALAGRLARLDFDVRTRWRRKDEIGELARTFDFLADNLSGTLEELQTANEKLRQDIEREKRLERMRRSFIAGVSHELKTPLSLIGGYAEGLKDNIGSGAKRERYAQVILEETRRMAAIVGDMLDLSHLESGQYSLRREAFSVAELLNGAADRAAALGEARSVRVSVDLPPGEEARMTAVADRFRIDQVLTNLVTNAVRHAPDGGAVELRAAAVDDEWQIVVFNEGEPIPEEELPRIWGQFYRIDQARSRESGGTGIGLAIVRQILELHGSRCGVRNENSGVAFAFTLRRAT